MAERDWAQFHTPENLAKSIAIEAGELLGRFQWAADADTGHVREIVVAGHGVLDVGLDEVEGEGYSPAADKVGNDHCQESRFEDTLRRRQRACE